MGAGYQRSKEKPGTDHGFPIRESSLPFPLPFTFGFLR
jgi:hypothetical protein